MNPRIRQLSQVFFFRRFNLISFDTPCDQNPDLVTLELDIPESEFNKFEPRLKSTKNRFQLSVGLNLLETVNMILSGTNHICVAT